MDGKTLAGRKALVTGGARGIGAAIADGLAKAGAAVMIGDVLEAEGRETAQTLGKTGVKTGFVPLDVSIEPQWENAVAATISALGGFDILVNNAGVEITSLVCDIKRRRPAPHVRRQHGGDGAGHEARLPRHAAGRRGRRRAALWSIFPRSPRPSPFRPSPAIPAPSRPSTA